MPYGGNIVTKGYNGGNILYSPRYGKTTIIIMMMPQGGRRSQFVPFLFQVCSNRENKQGTKLVRENKW
jgi:hypothetical protein